MSGITFTGAPVGDTLFGKVHKAVLSQLGMGEGKDENNAQKYNFDQNSQVYTELSKGGKVSSASARADGIAQRGKTRGTMVMCGGGYAKGKK